MGRRLQAAAGVLGTLRGPWILAADFNNTHMSNRRERKKEREEERERE